MNDFIFKSTRPFAMLAVFAAITVGVSEALAQNTTTEPDVPVLAAKGLQFPLTLDLGGKQSLDLKARSFTWESTTVKLVPAPMSAEEAQKYVNANAIEMPHLPRGYKMTSTTMPLAPNTVAVIRRRGVTSEELKVGDTVNLVDEARPQHVISQGNDRSLNPLTDSFKVVSLSPLTLRRGEETPGKQVVNLPFSKRTDEKPIGSLKVTQSLDVRQAATITVTITDTHNLLFDRWDELALEEVAADLEAHIYHMQPEVETTLEGKRQVSRLIAQPGS